MMHVIFTVTVGTASCHDPVGKGLVFGHRFPWLFRGVNLFYPRGVVVARNIYIYTHSIHTDSTVHFDTYIYFVRVYTVYMFKEIHIMGACMCNMYMLSSF